MNGYFNEEILVKVHSLEKNLIGYIKTFYHQGLVGFLAPGDEHAVGDYEVIETGVMAFLQDNNVPFLTSGRHLIWSNKLPEGLQTAFGRA